MEAIVLAGGFGTRLRYVVKDFPKPMAPVVGRPFLEYILDALANQGVVRVVLAVHYKKECIMEHFKNAYRGMEVCYSVEEKPLYTGGAVKKALTMCGDSRIWVLNGDTYFQVSLAGMAACAETLNASAVIAVKEMTDFSRYGKVDVDGDGRIFAFHEKAPCMQGLINGGVYCLDRQILESYPEVFSLENDCFPALLRDRQIAAFRSGGYFIDIGVPEDYAAAQSWFGPMGAAMEMAEGDTH